MLTAIIYSMGTIGSIIFAYFVPNIFWKTTWQDIIYLISHKNSTENRLSELLTQLGLSDSSFYDWAMNKLLLSLLISIVFLLLILFFIKIFIDLYKNSIKKEEEINKEEK